MFLSQGAGPTPWTSLDTWKMYEREEVTHKTMLGGGGPTWEPGCSGNMEHLLYGQALC